MCRNKTLAWTAALLLACCSASAAAEDDTISPDRPDFVDSAQVVGVGRVQLETSFAHSRQRLPGTLERVASTPTLLRLGLSDTLELRVESEGRVHASLDGAPESTRGWAGNGLAVKWHFADEAAGRPAMALIAQVDLDNGAAALRRPGKRYSLRLASEWDLPDDYSLGLMLGLARDVDEGGRRFSTAFHGIVLGKQWDARWRSFVELAQPTLARAEHGGSTASFDIGATYLLNPAVQLDTALSRGLNARTPDWRWTAGVSVKF